MPKRIVDGDAIWTSSRIRQIEPPRFRAEYANLIPLALANGSFECDPVLVWTRVYAFNRPDITFEDAKAILDEFERVGLLFRWANGNRKEWGFWVKIDTPGRLPSPTQRERMVCGEDPPFNELSAFIKLKENPRTVLGQSSLGLGLGVGLGLGMEGVGNGGGAARQTAALSQWQASADGHGVTCPNCSRQVPNSKAAIRRHSEACR